MKEQGFLPDAFTYSILMEGHSRCHNTDDMLAFFNEALEKGIQINSYTCGTLLNGLCNEGMVEKAEEVINKLKKIAFHLLRPCTNKGFWKLNCCSDQQSYLWQSVERLCKEHMILEVELLLREMEGRGVEPNTQLYNMIINAHSNLGKWQSALGFYDEMLKNKVAPTLQTYNAIIKGVCKKGKMDKSQDLFTEMRLKGLEPDVIMYNTPFQGYINSGNVSKSLELYGTMRSSGIQPTLSTYHIFMRLCSKLGLSLLDDLHTHLLLFGLKLDRLIYNTLISSYSEHGDLNKAQSLYFEMINNGVDPDKMTFNSLMSGHFNVGKSQGVMDLVSDMKARKLPLKADTYCVLVDGYCIIKDYAVAYVWYKEMIDSGFLLPVSTCKRLVEGLREEGRLKEVGILSNGAKVAVLFHHVKTSKAEKKKSGC